MNIIDYHNYFREKNSIIPSYSSELIVDENVDYLKLWILSSIKSIPPLSEHLILNNYALKASKWMARRGWNSYWNFDKTRKDLLELGFIEVDFNIGIGDNEEFIIKHFLNNQEKKDKMLSLDYKYIGCGVYESKYRYWTILYAR